MKIKKYFASDMRKALTMAREEQGPDVVILSNRKVSGGVELLAAEDYDEALYEQQQERIEAVQESQLEKTKTSEITTNSAQAAEPRRQGSVVVSLDNHQQQEKLIWTQNSVLGKMQDEIQTLRKLLEQQMSGLAWGQIGRSHPLWAGLLRRFGQLGLSPVIARDLVEQIPQHMELEKAWRLSLAHLSYRIRTVDDNILTPGRILAFVGSSGVGKTTTIAKLATRLKMQSDTSELILATTDTYRVGGRDQLKSFARILGIPVRTIHNKDELTALIDQYYGQKIIMIDTAGLSLRDKHHNEQMEILESEARRLTSCLVLSASALPTTNLEPSGNVFKGIKTDMSIITKLDEATTLGSLLSFLIEKDIAVAYASDGQQVPDDLQSAEAHKLIARAVATLKQYKQEPLGDEELEHIYGKFAVNEPFGE